MPTISTINASSNAVAIVITINFQIFQNIFYLLRGCFSWNALAHELTHEPGCWAEQDVESYSARKCMRKWFWLLLESGDEPALTEAELLGVARHHLVAGPVERLGELVEALAVVDRDLDHLGVADLGSGGSRLADDAGPAGRAEQTQNGTDRDESPHLYISLFLVKAPLKRKEALVIYED